MLSENKIISGSEKYAIRLLTYDDENSLQALCERCSDFSMLIEGRLPEKDAAHEILFDLPPSKDLKDKFVFGAFKDNDYLITVIDLIKDYKVAGEWTLGLMMIDPEERGNGLGRRFHEILKIWISNSHGKVLRIGVVEENHNAYKFWSKIGYVEVDRVKTKFGNKDHTVIIMNLCLT